MDMSFEVPMAACDQRMRSLVHRMLGGSAAASLEAYQLNEWLSFVAHGTTPQGSLVIAAAPQEILGTIPPGFHVEVRLDLIKQTLDPSVTILAAAAHVLGTLTWATPGEAAEHLASGLLPERVVETLTVPGARLGFIEVDQLMLRDMTGAAWLPVELLDRHTPTAIEDEHDAFGVVAEYDNEALKDLCRAVMGGSIPGIVTYDHPLAGICAHTAGRVFCLDVDTTGITVMLISPHETLRVFAQFPEPATSQSELPHLIGSVMRAAASV
ncbi:MAG: hypothetical protein QM708_13365 [Propioniciclava sp.]|uniref:hypothetical protein n=1 Tax=Propioniciclava sp. TaxID=2038686 RepID=UPI0039E6CDEB